MLDFASLNASPFGGLLNIAPSAGFPAAVDQEELAKQEALMAEQAREAAAARLGRNRGWNSQSFAAPDETSPAITMALGQPTREAPQYTPGPTFGSLAPMQAQPNTSQEAAGTPAQAAPIPQPRPAAASLAPSEDDGESDAAALPKNAMPTQGQQPNSAAQPAVPESSLFGRIQKGLSDNSNLLLGLGAGFAGAPSLGTGMSRALAAGATGSQMDQKAQALAQTREGLNQTRKALLAKGVPEADVNAAIGNKEMLAALLKQYYSADKLSPTTISKDRNGQPVYGSFNNQTGEVKPFNSPGNTETASAESNPNGLTGDDYLKTLDGSTASRVKAIAEGREAYPATSRASDAARIREAVHAYDPNFDAVNYNSRLSTRKDFTSGKSAQNLTAFGTAIGHLGTLYDSIDGLGNRTMPLYNTAANAISGQIDPQFQEAKKKFEAARTAVADELTRAFRGSGGNVHDIKQWEETINSADSPVALKAAVRQAAELLNSRVQAVGEQYNRGMGTTKDPIELLSAKSAKAFKHLLEGTNSGADQAAPMTGGTTASGLKWSVQ